MPARINWHERDPNGLGRGRGLYYRRSSTFKGKDYGRKGYYSKYSKNRDKAKLSTGWEIHKIGLPRGTKIPHVSDGKLWR